MQHTTSYKLLTFYKFVNIKNALEEVASHKQFCTDIGIKGRVYIGEEGISATMTCNQGQLRAYKAFISANPYFQDLLEEIEIKLTEVDKHMFDKMIVKYRQEIVALGKVVTAEQIAEANKVLSIEDFKKVMDEEKKDWAILDMRNDYERQLGHFKGAIPAGTINFREVKDLVKKYKEKLKNKKVLMYCTGGIRCEKLSTLLHEEGIDNFYGLEGGVVEYTNTFNDGNREGNLYTFDGRVSCDIGNASTHKTIARCIYTGEPTNHCENCRYSPCNARIIATEKSYRKHFGFCSLDCAEKAKKDILLKNADRDPIDYKSLRGIIKQDPTQKEAIIHKVSNRVKKHLLHVTFNHTTSQKDHVLYDW